jgi:hypothetical protein
MFNGFVSHYGSMEFIEINKNKINESSRRFMFPGFLTVGT